MPVPPLYRLVLLLLCAWPLVASAAPKLHDPPIELHHHLSPPQAVALTLDACSGAYDQRLVDLLVQLRIPATLFVTKRWLDRNAAAVQHIQRHGELFEFENHGAHHVPAVVGGGRRLYGMPVQPNSEALRAEIAGGADALRHHTGQEPHFFRGAGAAYDSQGRAVVQSLGYRIAGFSVNADGGATYPANVVAKRLLSAKPGDVVIAHMNHPEGGTAEGFARALPELQRRGVVFVKLSQTSLVPE